MSRIISLGQIPRNQTTQRPVDAGSFVSLIALQKDELLSIFYVLDFAQWDSNMFNQCEYVKWTEFSFMYTSKIKHLSYVEWLFLEGKTQLRMKVSVRCKADFS